MIVSLSSRIIKSRILLRLSPKISAQNCRQRSSYCSSLLSTFPYGFHDHRVFGRLRSCKGRLQQVQHRGLGDLTQHHRQRSSGARNLDSSVNSIRPICWSIALAASAACFASSFTSTALDDSPLQSDNTRTDKKGDDGDDDDPYSMESLPEQDEETDCFLCLTNRNGPCRPFWRPLEYCIKDADDNDGDSSVCDRYIRPFEDCWSRHAALYLLISHAVTQETQVQQVERDNPTVIVDSTDEFNPIIDWTAYEAFCKQDNGEREEVKRVNRSVLCSKEGDETPSHPLWKKFHIRQMQPIVVNVAALVPLQYTIDAKSGRSHKSSAKAKDTTTRRRLKLRMAYVLDQDDNLMGCVEVFGNEEENGKAKLIGKRLMVTVLPGYTGNLRFKALYSDEDYSMLLSTGHIPLVTTDNQEAKATD